MDVTTYVFEAALGSVIGFAAYVLLLAVLGSVAAFAWAFACSARRVCEAHVRQ